MTLTPSQAMERYHNIVVTFDAPTRPMKVSLTRYACSVYGGGQRERAQFRERLRAATRADRLGLTDQEYVDVFTGKGSPENIAKCLRLAARHGIYRHDGPVVSAGAGLTPDAGVKRVLDDYIGLDCNGFVGNWARMAAVPHARPDRRPLDWLSHLTLRHDLDAVGRFEVMVWVSGDHITVIDNPEASSGHPPTRRATVVESAAGGLQVGPYRIKLARTPATVSRDSHTYSTPFLVDSARHGPDVPVFIGRPHGLV